MTAGITIQIDEPNYPEVPILSFLGRDVHQTRLVAQVRLREPISSAGLASAVRLLVRAWYTPELGSDPDQQVSDIMDSLGVRLL